MPSHSADTQRSLWDRATAQRNVAIYAAILVAVPVAYGFHLAFDGEGADFLLLLTLAVGVPTSYNTYWPSYDRTWKAVAWVIVAAAAATAAFTGLFVAGTKLLALSPFPASIGAFLVTSLGGQLLLARWKGY
ncbi:hypothetical protein SAMN05216388_100257 [Halorientalis persicus]|jgi:hypothetical protein|uniref:Uncharacterized protein n=1 Tax=Halorientalis persicus TaxID=1367881 RepID=A0A1H8EMM5_9EURY|nr:hypothetical protein [Halorientalis persicus]SEN20831.1 hypothetical protein SAMN05216388_100257 [Halorientalis persicus]